MLTAEAKATATMPVLPWHCPSLGVDIIGIPWFWAIRYSLPSTPEIFVPNEDIYKYLIYDEFGFCTLTQVESPMKSRTLSINGVSKGRAMTGWWIGFIPPGKFS
ncbi:MAG: hypothetical protein ACTH5D_01485 [Halomonas sp.]|uniref:hypothetical protein n=1 Tax=Halomonas sp. TaxID=1486246 RepID=UPI003F90D0CA